MKENNVCTSMSREGYGVQLTTAYTHNNTPSLLGPAVKGFYTLT